MAGLRTPPAAASKLLPSHTPLWKRTYLHRPSDSKLVKINQHPTPYGRRNPIKMPARPRLTRQLRSGRVEACDTIYEESQDELLAEAATSPPPGPRPGVYFEFKSDEEKERVTVLRYAVSSAPAQSTSSRDSPPGHAGTFVPSTSREQRC